MLSPLNNQVIHGEGFIIRATLQLKNNFQLLILPGQFLEGKGHLTKQVLLALEGKGHLTNQFQGTLKNPRGVLDLY